jgi:hypothetical protein
MGAEGVGFEPTVAFATTVFKTVAFNRSAIPPSAGDFTIKKKVTLCSFLPREAVGYFIQTIDTSGNSYFRIKICLDMDFQN